MTYYKAKRDLNEAHYPFKGANPVMIEQDRGDIEDILTKMVEQGEAITWRQAHELCYFIVHQTRQLLQRELESEQRSFIPFALPYKHINNNLLANTCLHASSYAYFLAEKMGLKNTNLKHTHDFAKNLRKDHGFLTIELPIKTIKGIQKERFIIDVTYRQFFATYKEKNCKSYIEKPNKHNYLNIGNKVSKTFSTKVIADHLLRFGFIHASKKVASFYVKTFSNLPDAGNMRQADEEILEIFNQPGKPENVASSDMGMFYRGIVTYCPIEDIFDGTVNRHLHQMKKRFGF